MGVGSLFTYLSLIPNCATIVDLLSFGRGLTIGLDASCWLHALCHNPNVAKQLVFMNRVDALVHGFVERCQRLHEHGIILRVVFDGPAPAGKCSKSARTGRDANSKTLLRIRSQIRSGAAAESIPISDVEKAAGAALKALASTFSPDIAAQLRARGIGMCIRAREEADTQLAMECFCGAVDAVLTADSDFILLGSPIVLQMYHGDPVWTSWSRGGPVRVRVFGSAATGRSEFDPTPRAPAFDPTSPRTMAQLRVVWDLACEALGDVASAHEAAYAPHFDLPIRSAAAPPRSPPPPPPPAKSPAPRATPRTRARQRRKGRKVAAGSAGGSPRRVATAGGARGGTPTSAERRSAGRHSRARPVAPAAYASGTAMDLDDALARADDVHI